MLKKSITTKDLKEFKFVISKQALLKKIAIVY